MNVKHLLALLAGLLACMPSWAQALNPGVTQANIGSTICVSGWSATIRPSTAYTGALKRRLLRQAGIPMSRGSQYELDHWVPLSLGGAPKDPKNLRLQAWAGPEGATAKDVIESAMHREVCRGHVSLEEAQSCMAKDWHACPEASKPVADRRVT